MSTTLRTAYYEIGEEAAFILEIKAALATAGWSAVTSDSKELYKTALRDINGQYGYVYLDDDDGQSRIGVSVGADTGTDLNGLSYSDGSQIISRSGLAYAGNYYIWASERWFVVWHAGTPDPDGRFFIGGGLYLPFMKLAGFHPIFAMGNYAYNSGTTYTGRLTDPHANEGTLAINWFNDIRTPSLGGGVNALYNGTDVVDMEGLHGPCGRVFGPVFINRFESGVVGRYGCLYDAYAPTTVGEEDLGAAPLQIMSYNGYYYIAPQSSGAWVENALSHFGDADYSGPIFLRYRSTS